MANVTLRITDLLAQMTGGRREFPLEAETLRDAMTSMKRDWPTVAHHVFDETGGVREHVLLVLNGTSSRWTDAETIKLEEGDELHVLQAVSGG